MAKWTNKSLEPAGSPESENHVAAEDIARLAEGSVKNAEREDLLYHINRCQRCYQTLNNTLEDAYSMPSDLQAAGPWWKSKIALALAASIVLVFIITGQFAYKHWNRAPGVISATIDLNQDLKDILLEDDALRFGKGARLSRLLAVLQKTGLPVKDLNLVVLAKPYYQKKSLFGPKEVLHIRVENEVAYLEVKE